MRDVAEQAAVSPTTVSFVLAGREDMRISEDTRHRVLRAARELGYRPNLMARSLRTKVTRTIALISDTIVTDHYAGDLVHGSLTTAVEHDHLLVVSETEGDSAVEAQLIEHLLGRQVDGFLYATLSTSHVRIPRALAGQRVVLLNCVAPSRRIPAILPDELEAGRCAAGTLLAAGHRRGIYVVGEQPQDVFAARERMAGILAGLDAAGARLAGTVDCLWWPEPAHDAVTLMLRSGDRPAALICMNDRVAFGAYQALAEAGIAVPDQVSVISFDDSALAAWLRPQLCSIALPYLEMGRRAVETLLDPAAAPVVQRVPMPLRERASIAPPPASL
ncbi:MAG TPA: LacI family DNA-binding transcriptional regulator [Mycobacteriales bacterium]|jgi:LacI family transcriptional regulator|nr:LacI family DNA-binding transcriptional regulator [Mycobacteriales bacterium]